MPKKCIVCKEKASYTIRGTSDYYCEECAKEHFADLGMLEKVEEQALSLKKAIKEKMGDEPEDEPEVELHKIPAEDKK